jgi:hypothetical protein
METKRMVNTVNTSDKRWFDLDAVRTEHKLDPAKYSGNGYSKGHPDGIPGNESMPGNPAAPPLDWWDETEMISPAESLYREVPGRNIAAIGNGSAGDTA